MDFGAFLDFMLAWDNRSSWVGIQYFFPALDLKGRGYLTQVHKRIDFAVTMLLQVHMQCWCNGYVDSCQSGSFILL